jgi:hypothetical protein
MEPKFGSRQFDAGPFVPDVRAVGPRKNSQPDVLPAFQMEEFDWYGVLERGALTRRQSLTRLEWCTTK